MKSFTLLILFFLSLQIDNSYSQSFSNVAAQVGIFSYYIDEYYIPGGGVGFADYDNDNDPDLLVASKTHFKLLRNNNGVFTDVTSQSGIDFMGDCLKSVVWGDFNNDGNKDVFLTSWYSGSKLYKNNGNGTFSDVTFASGVIVPITYQTTTAAWGDIDRDGLIDLYIGNYGNIEGAGDQLNLLYRNNGNGSFSNITNAAGVADSVLKKPLVVTIFDYNMDGWQDIYIAMDKYQRSTMFKNNGNGTFQDVTWQTGTNCNFDAMGIAVGDYNHDGWLDIHVSNGPPGNATFRYNGNGTFTNVAVQTGTTVNKECWGNSFVDYDNDGWCDLYATASAGIDMCDVLLRNNRNNTFSNIGYSLGIRDSTFSYGVAKTDYNNDGYADILTTMSRDSNVHFYRNSGGSNKWIKLKCIGVQSNKDAYGTIVTAYYNGDINRQVILGGASFLSTDDPELIFGLGTSNQVDSLVIKWTNGLVERTFNLQANARYTAIEGSGVIGIQTISTQIPGKFALSQNYPNPFNPGTKIRFSLPSAELVQIRVFDIAGKELSLLLDRRLSAGTYETDFNAGGLSSGVYFYKMSAGSYSETKKMLLVK